MSENLATLVSRIQAQLLDDGTLFTTETVTSAVRQALRDFNQRAPLFAGELVEVTAGLKTYELSGGSFPAQVLDVVDVLKNDDAGEDDQPLDYDPVFEDNRVFIRLRTAESSGNLLIRFTQAHTINGLDSETESTLTADQDQVIVDGAIAYACLIRSTGIIEDNNLSKTAVKEWQAAAGRYQVVFEYGISRYADLPQPVSEPRKSSWLGDDLSLHSGSQAGSLRDL